MEKEKQIEEMAKLINGSKCPIEVCPKIDKEQEKVFGACNIHRAQILYDAGYGNVKEAEKETARECLKILNDIGGCDATEDYFKGWDAAIDGAYKDISDKFGVTAFDEEDEE